MTGQDGGGGSRDVAVRAGAGAGLAAVRRWYPWSIAVADPGLSEVAWAALRVLERHGLVEELGEFHTPAGGMESEYGITSYGDYLLALVADPGTSVAEGGPAPETEPD